MASPSDSKDDYRRAALTGILSNDAMVVKLDKSKDAITLEEAIVDKAIELGDMMEALRNA